MTTLKEKKPRKKKESKNSTCYLIHVFEDKDMIKHLYSVADVPKDKTRAYKLYKSTIIDDTMMNKYYHYKFIEQTYTTIETYPTNHLSK
jgi:hypothetical protein